jgi:hypothetical protein
VPQHQEEGMGSLAMVLLALAVVPALFPCRRDALMAGGVYLALMLAAFFWSHAGLSRMSRGEGPAFFATVLYFGLVQILLGGSWLARALVVSVAKRMPVAGRSRLAVSLLLAFGGPVAASLTAWAAGLSGKNLAVLTGVLFSPLLWFACALMLMPERAFKPQTPGGLLHAKRGMNHHDSFSPQEE